MDKKLLLLIIFIFQLFSANLVLAQEKELPKDILFEAQKLDQRGAVLQSYLEQFNSPLQHHASDFIEAADKYNLDWKLVAAIAGVESTFGKFVPGGQEVKYTSYNAWGWGVYGTQAIYFKSWKDGIFTVSKGLRENYLNKGLNDPYSINRVYAASPTWGSKVSYFLADMDKFNQNYQRKNNLTSTLNLEAPIAGLSGTITAN